MSRRKRGRPINGWLILDKPQGITSTQAVGKVKWLLQAQKAGHAGTLDPLATGVLPIALGEATKTVPFAVDGQKSYRFTVRWGIETNTDDAEGQPVKTSDARPTRASVEAALPTFTGPIQQVPPAFSAIKIDGERAYDLARGGEAVELQAREVEIDRFALTEMPDDATSVFEADCGKGTYVRALARDLGRLLGCYGHVTQLRRTRVGTFSDEDAIPLAELIAVGEPKAEGGEHGDLSPYLLPTETALEELPCLNVASNDAARLKRGQGVLLRGRDAPIMSGPVYAISKGELVALGEIIEGEFRPTRVFNVR